MNSFRFTYGSEIRIYNVFFPAKKSSARRRNESRFRHPTHLFKILRCIRAKQQWCRVIF